jgi:poly-gamma-glutamate synthesis protein (capsule biosynthesis protein)
MANFAIEGPDKFFEGKNGLINDSRHGDIRKLNSDFKKDSKRVMPLDSYKSILLKCIIDDKKIKSVSFLPIQLDEVTNDPEVLTANDPRFFEVEKYMEEITIDQKIAPHFTIEGNEVRII